MFSRPLRAIFFAVATATAAALSICITRLRSCASGFIVKIKHDFLCADSTWKRNKPYQTKIHLDPSSCVDKTFLITNSTRRATTTLSQPVIIIRINLVFRSSKSLPTTVHGCSRDNIMVLLCAVHNCTRATGSAPKLRPSSIRGFLGDFFTNTLVIVSFHVIKYNHYSIYYVSRQR